MTQELKRKIRILVAEDDITNQKVAKGILEKMGYRVDIVADGREAMKALETIPYSLVLMDIQMPEIDGFEATKMIRNNVIKVSSQNVPIIAMTARAMKGDKGKCIEAGMNDYVTKPVQPGELARVINRWVFSRSAPEKAELVCLDDKPMTRLNWVKLLKRLNGDEELSLEILDTYIQDGAEQIVALEKAVAQFDVGQIQQLGHRFKGSAANAEAMIMLELAIELEQSGKDGNITMAKEVLEKIQTEYGLLKQLVEDMMPS
ncbi:MAG: response regulator [Deltaproteobacteria bacterium]|nr:response regulator [Deltaproteobacteria bacterium]